MLQELAVVERVLVYRHEMLDMRYKTFTVWNLMSEI